MLRIAAKRRGDRSAIADLRQEGSLKALFPREHGAALQAVFLNTAGGLTGGDRMKIAVTAKEESYLVVSSQAAERAYRAQPDQTARTEVAIDVRSRGRVEWIPQETILFDGAALDRRLRVDLAENASTLIVEPVIFGRAAMGETVRDLRFSDQWRVYRNGRLVFADAVRLNGDAADVLTRLGVAKGAGAMATVLFAGPAAASMVPKTLPENVGASLISDGVLLLRFLAADSFALRRDLIPVIEALSGATVPRVWRL